MHFNLFIGLLITLDLSLHAATNNLTDDNLTPTVASVLDVIKDPQELYDEAYQLYESNCDALTKAHLQIIVSKLSTLIDSFHASPELLGDSACIIGSKSIRLKLYGLTKVASSSKSN